MLKSIAAVALLSLVSLAPTVSPAQARAMMVKIYDGTVIDSGRLMARFATSHEGKGTFFVLTFVGLAEHTWFCSTPWDEAKSDVDTLKLVRIVNEEPLFDPQDFLESNGYGKCKRQK